MSIAEDNLRPVRFEDTNEVLYNLIDEILVVCPRCKSCARITILVLQRTTGFIPRRLSCVHCGYCRDQLETTVYPGFRSGPIVDDFFGEILWLQIPVRNEVLWAYNERHLALIASYVGAQLREHHRHAQLGWHNGSLVNRLPRWMTSKKNRAEILKCIQKLRAR